MVKIFMVFCSFGSSIFRGWKRLDKALSLTIVFLYSLVVVAPIHLIVPLAKAGFKMFDASIAPSAPPAPTMVWTSSKNRIISPSFSNSLIIFWRRSSNSPLYFVPATNEAMSNAIIFFPIKLLGTFSCVISLANSSTMAVLPTPASPIKIGLFFLRRHNISINLFISLFLPSTGSSLLFFASFVRLVPNSSTNSFFLWLFFLINFELNSSYSCSIFRSIPIKMRIAIPSPLSKRDENKCSGVTSPLLFSLASNMEFSIIFFKSGVYKVYGFFLEPVPIILIISVLNLL